MLSMWEAGIIQAKDENEAFQIYAQKYGAFVELIYTGSIEMDYERDIRKEYNDLVKGTTKNI